MQCHLHTIGNKEYATNINTNNAAFQTRQHQARPWRLIDRPIRLHSTLRP